MSKLMKSPNNGVPQEVPAKTPPSKKGADMQKMVKKYGLTASVILFVVLLGSCVLLFKGTINAGAKAMTKSYSAAFETERQNAYDTLYNSAFKRGKEKYHVSNRAIISVANIKKTEKLQVIEVYQKEYVTRDRSQTTGNVTAWIEVSGKGIFVVDLKAAEFIVDNERCYVSVRVPYPELEVSSLQSVESELFKDDWGNGSDKEGVRLTFDMTNEGTYKIKKSLMSNPYIYKNAQTVAVSMIENLVKELNPGIPELTVEVEFMD